MHGDASPMWPIPGSVEFRRSSEEQHHGCNNSALEIFQLYAKNEWLHHYCTRSVRLRISL